MRRRKYPSHVLISSNILRKCLNSECLLGWCSIYQARCHSSLFHSDSILLRSLWCKSELIVIWYIEHNPFFFFSFFLFREVQNTGKGRYDIVLLKLLNINWSVVKLSVIYNERGFCGVGSHLSKTTLTPLPHIHLKSIKNWYSSWER